MKKELKKDIIDILDNVKYWETCPEDYKLRINEIIKQLRIGGVVSSAFAKEMYSKINERTRNHKGRNAPQILKDDALEMVEETVVLINSKYS